MFWQFVKIALTEVSKRGGACFDSAAFDLYSTPSRDRRLKLEIEEIKLAYEKYQALNIPMDPFIHDSVKNLFDDIWSPAQENLCLVELGQGLAPLPLGEIYSRLKREELSSNPNDSAKSRWGFQPVQNEKNCPVY